VNQQNELLLIVEHKDRVAPINDIPLSHTTGSIGEYVRLWWKQPSRQRRINRTQ